jgi:uncharacterized membrane protein
MRTVQPVLLNLRGTCCAASALAVLVTAVSGAWLPANAAFKICNQSAALYNVAIGAEIEQRFHTEGWWTLPSDTCVTPIKEDLDALKLRYVYVYATTVTGDSAFAGDWPMCIDSKRFRIEKIQGQPWNCWVRGFEFARFKEIDTGQAKSWTLFVRDTGH